MKGYIVRIVYNWKFHIVHTHAKNIPPMHSMKHWKDAVQRVVSSHESGKHIFLKLARRRKLAILESKTDGLIKT